MAMLDFLQNRYFSVESTDSIIANRSILVDFLRLRFWSIFGETSDIRVFKDAESNDNVLSSSNGIFLVESICSIDYMMS